MTALANESEPRVVVCLYDLCLWFLQRTNRFPRNWRVTLGDEIDRLMVSMLLVAAQARMRSEKVNFRISGTFTLIPLLFRWQATLWSGQATKPLQSLWD